MSAPQLVSPPIKIMRWAIDEPTANAAAACPLQMLRKVPAGQFVGTNFDTQTWNNRVIQPAIWKGIARSAPQQIIAQFQNGYYTQALALVVSWGGMARRSKDIYRERKPEFIQQIDRILRGCAKSIEESESIEHSWKALTGHEDEQLGWSEVMASKALHFLCRSLGYTHNPPVPIDGAVIRERLWPLFRYSMPLGQNIGDWNGDTFDAYCRYMTGICTWADLRQWTTTQLESTLYEHFSQ